MIAVDWITNNVYYTQQSSTVTACTYDRNCTEVLQAKYSIITGIAVDPMEGRLFIACYKRGFLSSSEGGIFSYGMDGNNGGFKKLSGDKLGSTGGISLDIFKKQVFWVDKSRGKLIANNYDGTNLVEVLEVS